MKRKVSERYKKALVTVAMGFRTEEEIKKNGLSIFTKEETKNLISYLNYLYNKKENILALKVKQEGYHSVHVNIRSKLELVKFIEGLPTIYKEYSEIWIISSSITECWRCRIYLSNTSPTDIIELAYSTDDHILDNIDSTDTTPYACYRRSDLSIELFKTNLDEKTLEKIERIINNILFKYSKKLTEVKHELSILNVDEISLDVRINKTYDFHDFDVAYGKTKKVMDYYLSRIESII